MKIKCLVLILLSFNMSLVDAQTRVEIKGIALGAVKAALPNFLSRNCKADGAGGQECRWFANSNESIPAELRTLAQQPVKVWNVQLAGSPPTVVNVSATIPLDTLDDTREALMVKYGFAECAQKAFCTWQPGSGTDKVTFFFKGSNDNLGLILVESPESVMHSKKIRDAKAGRAKSDL